MHCCVSRAGKTVLVFFRWYDKLASSKILRSGDYDRRKHERTLEYITRALCNTYMYVCCAQSKVLSRNAQIILLKTPLTVFLCCPQSQKKKMACCKIVDFGACFECGKAFILIIHKNRKEAQCHSLLFILYYYIIPLYYDPKSVYK